MLQLFSILAVSAAAAPPIWSVDLPVSTNPIGAEPEFASVAMTVTRDHILVTAPFVPSHCGEVVPFAGRVTALDRRSGARAFVAPLRQVSGDQAAFTRTWSSDEYAVFATPLEVVAIDSKGTLAWRRSSFPPTCGEGPLGLHTRALHPRGRNLYWPSTKAGHVCRLDLTTGRPSRKRATLPAAPRACRVDPPAGRPLLGSACGRRADRYRAVARCGASGPCRVVVERTH